MEIRDVPPMKKTLLSLSLNDSGKDLKTNENLETSSHDPVCSGPWLLESPSWV